MGVKHKFTSLKADDADTTLVRPSDWNADHQLVASSTDNAIPRFDGTGGDALQDSGVTIDDSDNLTVPGTVTADTLKVWRGLGAATGNLAVSPTGLESITTGVRNTVIGNTAGASLTTGNDNNFIGRLAGNATTAGNGNTAIGYNALLSNTSGSFNFALGTNALTFSTTGDYGLAIGEQACYARTTAPYATGIGWAALRSCTTGTQNLAVGAQAAYSITTGTRNIAIGHFAARDTPAGTFSVKTNERGIYIGHVVQSAAEGSDNEIVIGNGPTTAGANVGKGTNTTVIGNTATTEFWAYGTHRLDAENIETDTTTGTKIGTGTTQKLGFWNATPIAQPDTGVAEAAFVENAGGTAVNDDSTFDGYTLRQVVKALRNAGLLA